MPICLSEHERTDAKIDLYINQDLTSSILRAYKYK